MRSKRRASRRGPGFEDVKADALGRGLGLQQYAEQHLTACGRTFVCPSCGSGTHENHSPALSITGERFRCFSCGAGGDVFDLAGLAEGIAGGPEDRSPRTKRGELEAVANWAGIELGGRSGPKTSGELERRGERIAARLRAERGRKEADRARERAWEAGRERHARIIAEAQAELMEGNPAEAWAYLSSRGIGRREAEAWGLGYLRSGCRLLIPYPGTAYYHADRTINRDCRPKYVKPGSAEVGPEPLWNPRALDSGLVVLVEGQLDALAVQSLGYQAISCGGHGVRTLTAEVARRRWHGVALVVQDSDESGITAGLSLCSRLFEAGAFGWPFVGWPWSCARDAPEYGDPFEWWQASREEMAGALAAATADAARAAAEFYGATNG